MKFSILESDFWSCGTEILTNSTHITYTNGVSFSRGSFSLEINFNCSWETDLYVAEPFGVKINPITFVSVTLPKQNRGKFPIGMHLFRDQTYALDNMFNSPPELEVGTNQNPNWMYVGIRKRYIFMSFSIVKISPWIFHRSYLIRLIQQKKFTTVDDLYFFLEILFAF